MMPEDALGGFYEERRPKATARFPRDAVNILVIAE
jgi:hypothetical protein